MLVHLSCQLIPKTSVFKIMILLFVNEILYFILKGIDLKALKETDITKRVNIIFRHIELLM